MRKKKLAICVLAVSLALGSTFTSLAAPGWVKNGTGWWYQNQDNSWPANQWLFEGNTWFYLNSAGYMQVGWLKPADGQWYFLTSNGAMQKGLIEVNGNVYFMNDNGSMFIGEKSINGTTYNFTENGTTNGKPYTNAKYNSNGANVSSSGSSGEGGGSPYNKTTVDYYKPSTQQAVKATNAKIESALNEIAAANKNLDVSTDLDNMKVTLAPAKDASPTVSDLGDVQKALFTALESTKGTDFVYKYGTKEFKADDIATAKTTFDALYLSNKDDSLAAYVGNHTVTLSVNGTDSTKAETVTYTITVK